VVSTVGRPRRRRGRSAARRLGIIVAVTIVAYACVGGLIAVQMLGHARDVARADATFAAKMAARSVDDALALARTTLAGMAVGFPTQKLLADPSTCQLRFTGLGPFRSGHVDIVTGDGQLVCSSLADRGAPTGATQAGAPWLSQPTPSPTPVISQPFVDRPTGSEAVAVALPLLGPDGQPLAVVAFVFALPALSEGLAATYAGPRGFDFTVRTGDEVLSGGTNTAGQIHESVQVTSVSWQVDAGIPEAEALAATNVVVVKGVALGTGALLVLLLVLVLVNRQIARPLDRLAVSEGSLRASEERLRLLLSGASDYALVMLDTDGRVVSWSAGARLLDGYAEEDILGRHYHVFFTSDEVAADRPGRLLSSTSSIGRQEDEGVRVRQDGSRYWSRSVLTAQRDSAGELKGFVIVTHDATARHEAEVTVTRMNAELEERVGERTTQLQNQAAELHAANTELQSFSYSVSHDLRGPLRAITGFAAILAEACADHVPEQANHYAARITQNAETLTNMVNALLSMSATQQSAISSQQLDLTELARTVWDELTIDLQGRSVQFELQPLPPGRGDPYLVRQVLTNLFENALKYSGKREHTTIEVGSRTTPDCTVYFVRDNGAGFDMESSDRLFKAFQRLHNTEDFQGTGIGLALVHRIISRHGGQIWAEGEPDQGATFYFTLGQRTRQPAAAEPAPRPVLTSIAG
jgi:PAS domain S-box-containing protein